MLIKCRLCLEEKELKRSHLLPKALYKLIGSGTDPAHPDTVQITFEGSKKSSEQVWRHLLCSGCEKCLNENGESWVLRNCYRGRGRFRLRTELKTRPNLSLGSEFATYAASAIEITKLAHFCLGVVWKASLCDWPCRGKKYQQIELGPYQERIRTYLNAKAGVPENVDVDVMLSELNPPALVMSLPWHDRVHAVHCYTFQIPGITFFTMVGRPGLEGNRSSILRDPNPIIIGKNGDRLAQDEMTRLMGRVPPRGYEAPLVNGTERT